VSVEDITQLQKTPWIRWAVPYWKDIDRSMSLWREKTIPRVKAGKYHIKIRRWRWFLILKAYLNASGVNLQEPARLNSTDPPRGWAQEFYKLALELDTARCGAHKSKLRVWKEREAQTCCTFTLRYNPEEKTIQVALDRKAKEAIQRAIDWDCSTGSTLEKKGSWRSIFWAGLEVNHADPLQFKDMSTNCDGLSWESSTTLKYSIPIDHLLSDSLWSLQTVCWEQHSGIEKDKGHSSRPRVCLHLVQENNSPSRAKTLISTPQKSGSRIHRLDLHMIDQVFKSQDVCVSVPIGLEVCFTFSPKKEITGSRKMCHEGKHIIWVLTPSYARHANSDKTGLFDRHEVLSDCASDKVKFVQVLLVREVDNKGSLEFHEYRNYLGSSYVIVQMPEKMRLDKLQNWPKEGQEAAEREGEFADVSSGIGYARLFGQVLAHALGIDRVWMIDDNVKSCFMWDVGELREQADFLQNCGDKQQNRQLLSNAFKQCSFANAMLFIEEQVLGFLNTTRSNAAVARPDSEETFLVRKLREEKTNPESYSFQRETKELNSFFNGYEKQAPAKNRGEYAGKYAGLMSKIAIVGMNRDQSKSVTDIVDIKLKAQQPFKPTHSVYSFYLLNVKSTVAHGLYYPACNVWEDIQFNHMCREKDMLVLKCRTFIHTKQNLQQRFLSSTQQCELLVYVRPDTSRPILGTDKLPPVAIGQDFYLTYENVWESSGLLQKGCKCVCITYINGDSPEESLLKDEASPQGVKFSAKCLVFITVLYPATDKLHTPQEGKLALLSPVPQGANEDHINRVLRAFGMNDSAPPGIEAAGRPTSSEIYGVSSILLGEVLKFKNELKSTLSILLPQQAGTHDNLLSIFLSDIDPLLTNNIKRGKDEAYKFINLLIPAYSITKCEKIKVDLYKKENNFTVEDFYKSYIRGILGPSSTAISVYALHDAAQARSSYHESGESSMYVISIQFHTDFEAATAAINDSEQNMHIESCDHAVLDDADYMDQDSTSKSTHEGAAGGLMGPETQESYVSDESEGGEEETTEEAPSWGKLVVREDLTETTYFLRQ
jgi:hypothetical protein